MYPTVISARSLGYKKQLRHEGPGSMTWIRGGPLELDRANIIAGVEGSLKRLGTDYIDLLLLHWPDRYVPMFGGSEYDVSNVYDFCPFEEQIKTLNTLQGKIIQFGLGNETAYGVAKFSSLCDSIPGGLRLSVVQNAYSPLCRTFASSGLGQIRAMKGVGLAYSPLAKGLLSGKHDDHGASADPEARLVKFKGVRRSRVEVTSAVIGASSTSQLRLLSASWDNGPLDKDILAEIDAIQAKYPNPTP